MGARDYHGRTPLHEVCFSDNYRAAKLLIQLRADVNAVDKCGMTPLHIASKCERRSLIRTFLEMGADPLVYDLYNESILHVTETNKKMQIEILRSCGKVREKLREKLTQVHLLLKLSLKKQDQGNATSGLLSLPDDIIIKNILGEVEKEIIFIDNLFFNTEEVLSTLLSERLTYNFRHLYKYLLSGLNLKFVSV